MTLAYSLNMQRHFLNTWLILSWISIIFISACIYMMDTSIWTQEVMHMSVWNKRRAKVEPSYKCFQLFNNSNDFRRFIDSKNGSCGLLNNGDWAGRSGNQMFESAAVIGMAQQLDMIPVLNLKKCLISNYFNFPNTLNSDINNATKCYEKGAGIYTDCSDIYRNLNATQQNIMILGFRQSWKYFDGATEHIRNMFQFKTYYITKARHFISNQTIYDHDNVCIHVRRGDFLKLQDRGRTVAGTDFLSKAMTFYENKFKRVRFIVLSDDIAWCKQSIKGNVTFSPYTDPGVDLAIMSLCDHAIVTSGTFGWWGAWLSNGTVVYFHGFPRKDSPLGRVMNNSDYYPPSWIKL